MATKKSRKVGRIGIPKSDAPKRSKPPEKARQKKGNKSGSRQQVTRVKAKSDQNENLDPRVGSKKTIDLSKYKSDSSSNNIVEPHKPERVKYKTPQDEIEAIENNKELDALLEKQASSSLNEAEQAFVDKLTTRYQALCELAGIDVNNVDEDDQKNDELDDPFAKLDAIKLDDYKD